MSAQLMLRAGMLRQSSAGVYTLLPLAVRALRNIADVIREELARVGAQEISMPCLAPAALWSKSGRLQVRCGTDDGCVNTAQTAGPELMTVRDRRDVQYVLSPTHEEVWLVPRATG